MQVSAAVLEKMGLRPRSANEDVSASFISVIAWQIYGVVPTSTLKIDKSGSINGVDFRLAISSSLNSAAQALFADDFDENEDEWARKKECAPPYMLLHIGPSSLHRISDSAFLKWDETGLQTYEGFLLARSELREMASKVIPSLHSALACCLIEARHPIRFRELERFAVGRTPEGVRVFDFNFQSHIELQVAQTIDEVDLSRQVDRAIGIAERMPADISSFYSRALNEEDPLKRFLYLFLTIERQTHASFKSIDHDAHVRQISRLPTRVQASGSQFLLSQPSHWKNLSDRFQWCAMTVWTHLTDDDVADFVRAKKIRDKLTHGVITEPPLDAVRLAEKISAKLQIAPPFVAGKSAT